MILKTNWTIKLLPANRTSTLKKKIILGREGGGQEEEEENMWFIDSHWFISRSFFQQSSFDSNSKQGITWEMREVKMNTQGNNPSLLGYCWTRWKHAHAPPLFYFSDSTPPAIQGCQVSHCSVWITVNPLETNHLPWAVSPAPPTHLPPPELFHHQQAQLGELHSLFCSTQLLS